MGKTGAGKSRAIKQLFNVIEYVPIGHTLDSETKNVNCYHPADKSLFAGDEICDSPGFDDTEGLSNDEILEITEVAFTELNATDSHIDGMILVVKTIDNRDASALYITNYIDLFGEEMLPNLMIIINRFEL